MFQSGIIEVPDSPLARIFPFVLATPLLLLFMLFIRKFLLHRHKMYAFLVALFAIATINVFLVIGASFAADENLAIVLFIGAQVIEVLALLLTVLLLGLFEDNRALSFQSTIFIATSAMLVGSILTVSNVSTKIVGGMRVLYFARGTLTSILSLALSALAILWLFRAFLRSRRVSRGKQRILVYLLFIGIFCSQLGGSGVPVAMETTRLAGAILLAQNLRILQGIGFIIVGIGFYIVGNRPWLLQRQRVHLLMVYSTNGVLLYSKSFREDITELDITLLSGAITALSSVFNESTKMENPLKHVEFEGKNLRIINRGTFITALLTDCMTDSTEFALSNFVREFHEKFATELENFRGNVGIFGDAEEIASKYFS